MPLGRRDKPIRFSCKRCGALTESFALRPSYCEEGPCREARDAERVERNRANSLAAYHRKRAQTDNVLERAERAEKLAELRAVVKRCREAAYVRDDPGKDPVRFAVVKLAHAQGLGPTAQAAEALAIEALAWAVELRRLEGEEIRAEESAA